jgi:hypothetical protein
VTLKLLWQEDRQAHPDGYQYSQFCERYRRWAYALDVTMRIPHRGGEEVEVDYAGATIEIVNPATGEITRAYVFVAVLPASGYFYVEVQPECTLPHWIGGNVRALEFFGGVPRILIPDNLKTGVKRPEFYEPDINPTFQYFAACPGRTVQGALWPGRAAHQNTSSPRQGIRRKHRPASHPLDIGATAKPEILQRGRSEPGGERIGESSPEPTDEATGEIQEGVIRRN